MERKDAERKLSEVRAQLLDLHRQKESDLTVAVKAHTAALRQLETRLESMEGAMDALLSAISMLLEQKEESE